MSQLIDWPGIRAAAVALKSVRAAAMNASAHLPPDEQRRFVERVNKRALRERWTDKANAIVATVPPPGKPMSKLVQTGAESLQNKLADDSDATRLALSMATRKHAQHLAKLKPSTSKDRALAAKSWAGVGSTVHGWEAGKGGGGVSLNILSIGGDMVVNPS